MSAEMEAEGLSQICSSLVINTSLDSQGFTVQSRGFFFLLIITIFILFSLFFFLFHLYVYLHVCGLSMYICMLVHMWVYCMDAYVYRCL